MQFQQNQQFGQPQQPFGGGAQPNQFQPQQQQPQQQQRPRDASNASDSSTDSSSSSARTGSVSASDTEALSQSQAQGQNHSASNTMIVHGQAQGQHHPQQPSAVSSVSSVASAVSGISAFQMAPNPQMAHIDEKVSADENVQSVAASVDANVQSEADAVHAQGIQHRFSFQPIEPMSYDAMHFAVSADVNNAQNMAAEPALPVDVSGDLPPENSSEVHNIADAVEGHDVEDMYAPESPAMNPMAPVAAPDPVIEKQQSQIFGAMLQQKDKAQHLQREENWDMLVEGIEQNCPRSEQYSVFKAMRRVSQNLLQNDEKYRTLYADNDMVQRKILGRVGGYEFLRGLGFKQGLDENELVCSRVDRTAISHAITALNTRIEKLRATKHEWDPKVKVNAQAQAQQQSGQNNSQMSEEERQLQEVIRISQEQHVRDMRMRQQRELDLAKRTRLRQQQSVKMYSVNEEQDHKAQWEQM